MASKKQTKKHYPQAVNLTEVSTKGDSIYCDTVIDSLYFSLDSLITENSKLYSRIDSLKEELKYSRSQISIDTDFYIPDSVDFCGEMVYLNNDRIRQKFQKIFNLEVNNSYKHLAKSGKYFTYLSQTLNQFELHDDFKYLAVAESYLSSSVTSHVGAAGLWQFMPSTAKGFGLKINKYVDERRHLIKSTEAACKLLNSNYDYLNARGAQDWLLAMCAYNAGAGTVLKDVRAQGGNRFQDLMMRVEETNLYVWRTLAIKLIYENEEKIFGKIIQKEKPFFQEYRIEAIVLSGYHELNGWARAQGSVLNNIWQINPWIKIYKQRRSKYTPINKVILSPGKYEVFVPRRAEKITTQLAEIEDKFKRKTTYTYDYYSVKRGDNLSQIARRFNMTLTKLKALNGLYSNVIYPGQKLKIKGKISKQSTSQTSSTFHIVKKGDTIADIAYKYKTTAEKLKSINDLNSDHIYPGQKLRFKAIPQKRVEYKHYTVKSGDTLGEIAEKFHYSLSKLLATNDLGKAATIYVGQKLKIPAKKFTRATTKITPKTKYIVKKGDTLSEISEMFGISVSKIKKANSISGNNIYVGQTLSLPISVEIYEVKKGDNLGTIATKFNVSVNSIKQINGLTSDVIFVGQKLQITVR